MRKRLFLLLLAFISLCQMYAVERTKLNFNGGWLLKVGDFQGAEQANYKDAGWKQITLPRAFNEKEAFKVSIEQLSDTIMWYRKHFHIQEMGDRKYFIEWGVQQGILPRATYQKAMDKAWKALAASVHESPAPTRRWHSMPISSRTP